MLKEPPAESRASMSTPQERFKIHDASSYDGVASSFDRWTQFVTRSFADRLVGLAGLCAGNCALDVGTGTGVVGLASARMVCPGGSVVGIDLSEGMLNTARANARAAALDGCTEFRYMDAEVLQFEDATFDAVVSLFALRHLPDPARALREMFRVVKPGHRVVVGIGSGLTLSWAGLAAIASRIHERWRMALGRVLVAPGALDSLVRKHLPHAAALEEIPSSTGIKLQISSGKLDFRT